MGFLGVLRYPLILMVPYNLHFGPLKYEFHTTSALRFQRECTKVQFLLQACEVVQQQSPDVLIQYIFEFDAIRSGIHKLLVQNSSHIDTSQDQFIQELKKFSNHVHSELFDKQIKVLGVAMGSAAKSDEENTIVKMYKDLAAHLDEEVKNQRRLNSTLIAKNFYSLSDAVIQQELQKEVLSDEIIKRQLRFLGMVENFTISVQAHPNKSLTALD